MSSTAEDEAEASESIATQIREIEVAIEENIDEHVRAKQSLQDVLEEIKSEYEDEDIDDTIRNTIREAYQDNAQNEVRKFRDLNDAVPPEQYCEDIEGLADQLSSILNEPHARKLVNDMSTWLTDMGSEPLDEEERDELVETFRENVNSTRENFEDLKDNWSSLRDQVPIEEPLLSLVHTQLKNSERGQDIRSLALDVQSVGNELDYPVELDTDGPPAEKLEAQINTILTEKVKTWTSSSDRFSQLKKEVTSRWDTIQEPIVSINDNVDRLDDVTQDIISEGMDADKVETLIDRIAEEPISQRESLEELEEFTDSLVSVIEMVREMTRTNLDRFGHKGDGVPARIEDIVAETTGYESDARNARNTAIAADTISVIKEKKDDFDEAVGDANERLEQLENDLKSQVHTIEQVAAQFNADDELERARTLRNRLPSLTQLSDYISGFRKYEEIRAKVLEEAREGLSDDESELFDHIINQGGELTIGAGDIDKIITEFDWSDERLGNALTGLNEEGVINLNVSVF